MANHPNASTVPLSFCHVHPMRYARDDAVRSLRADGTNTKPGRGRGREEYSCRKKSRRIRVLKPTRRIGRADDTSEVRVFRCRHCKHANFPPEFPISLHHHTRFVQVGLLEARLTFFLTALMNGEGDFENVLPRPLLEARAK